MKISQNFVQICLKWSWWNFFENNRWAGVRRRKSAGSARRIYGKRGSRREWKERRIECIKIINYKIHEEGEEWETRGRRSRGLQKYGGKSNKVPVYVCSLLSVYSADQRRTSELKCRFRKIFSRLSNGWSMFLANYHRALVKSEICRDLANSADHSLSFVTSHSSSFLISPFFVAKTWKTGRGESDRYRGKKISRIRPDLIV